MKRANDAVRLGYPAGEVRAVYSTKPSVQLTGGRSTDPQAKQLDLLFRVPAVREPVRGAETTTVWRTN